MKHFTIQEFACKCKSPCAGKKPQMDPVLLAALDDLREAYGAPLTITSGLRCDSHNAAVRGSKRSQHLAGTAADITCSDLQLLLKLASLDQRFTGIGVSGVFLHLDARPGKRVLWRY